MATPAAPAPDPDDPDDEDDAREATIQAAYRTVFDPEARRSSHRSLWTQRPDTPRAREDLIGRIMRDDNADVVQVMSSPLQDDADSGTQHQNMTQVQVVRKTDGSYTIFVDGVERDPTAPIKIRHFHGPHQDEDMSKTMVGPLAISLMTESGQRAPDAAVVRVRQVTKIDRMDPTEVVVLSLDLPSYSVDEYRAPCVTLPFPAWFTEPPYIMVDDVFDLRRFQSRRFVHIFLPIVLQLISTLVGTYWFGNEAGFNAVNQNLTSDALAPTLWGMSIVLSFLNQYTLGSFLGGISEAQADLLVFGGTGGTLPDGTPRIKEEDMPGERSKIFGRFLNNWASTKPKEPRRGSRKFYIRGFNRALRRLVAVDEQSPEQTDNIIRSQYKDEAILADWLMEPEGSKDLLINFTQDETTKDWSGWTRQKFQDVGRYAKAAADYTWGQAEYIANKLFGEIGASPQDNSDPTKPAKGIVVAKVGKPNLSGLDVNVLRKNYVRSKIEIEVYDSSLQTPGGTWKVVIEAEEDCGFRAGWYASGLSQDVRDLASTVDYFCEEFCKDTRVSQQPPQASTVATRSVPNRLLGGLPNWWANIQSIRRYLLCANKEKLIAALYGGDDTQNGAQRSLNGLRNIHEYRLIRAGTPDKIHRVLPQRFVLNSNSTFRVMAAELTGVYAINSSNEAVAFSHPVDNAIVEMRRHLQRTSVATQALVSKWESSTSERTIFYQCYEYANDTLKVIDNVVSLVGSQRTSFAKDGVIIPLEMQDRLTLAYDNRTTDETFPIALISTPIKRTDSRSDKARPLSHHEVVGRHALADALIARLVMRGCQADELNATMGAISDFRSGVNSMVEMFKSCQQEHARGYRGILSQNDLYFQCFPFGTDLARLVFLCGAWDRSETVSVASGVTRTDRTLHQRIAKQNMWPSEAETHLRNCLTSLRHVLTLELSHLPVYALQNTLSLAHGGVDTEEFKRFIVVAAEAFIRTLHLAELLELTDDQRMHVAEQQVIRWPIFFSLKIALVKSDRVDEYETILRDAVSEVVPRNALGKLWEDSMTNGYVKTSLKYREERLRKDLSYLRYPGVSEDEREYHVPFAHGDLPYSIVRMFSGPGNENLESVPIRLHLIGEYAISLELTEDVGLEERLEIVVHNDHPFEIRIQEDAECKLTAKCALAFVIQSDPTESRVPKTADGNIATISKAVNKWFETTSRSGVTQGSDTAVIIAWNAERILQTLLLLIARDDCVDKTSTIHVKPPALQRYVAPPTDYVLEGIRDIPEAQRELRRAFERHLQTFHAMFRHRDFIAKTLKRKLNEFLSETRTVRRAHVLRRLKLMLLRSLTSTMKSYALWYALREGSRALVNSGWLVFPFSQQLEDDEINDVHIAMVHRGPTLGSLCKDNPQSTGALTLREALLQGLRNQLHSNVKEMSKRLSEMVVRRNWDAMYSTTSFPYDLVRAYALKLLPYPQPASDQWENLMYGLLKTSGLVSGVDRAYRTFENLPDQAEKAQVLTKLKEYAERNGIPPDDLKPNQTDDDRYNMAKSKYATELQQRTSELQIAMTRVRTVGDVMKETMEMRVKEEANLKKAVEARTKKGHAALAVSTVLANAMLHELIGWAPQCVLYADVDEDEYTSDVLERVARCKDSDRQVALVEACLVLDQIV